MQCLKALIGTPRCDLNQQGDFASHAGAFLHHAGCHGWQEGLEAVVNTKRVDLDARCHFSGLTALAQASTCGQLGCVKALIKAGANVDLPCPEGCTPAYMAVQEGRLDCLKALVDAGADLLVQHSNGGANGIQGGRRNYRVTASKNGHVHIVKFLEKEQERQLQRATPGDGVLQSMVAARSPPELDIDSKKPAKKPSAKTTVEQAAVSGATEERCQRCRKVCPKLKTCSRCMQVKYCSASCQKDDWKDHKTSCVKAGDK